MSNNPVKHLSHSLCLDISKLPCKEVDRYPLFNAVIFFLLALVLIITGVYELFNGVRMSEAELAKLVSEQGRSASVVLMSPTLFDVILIIMGVGLALTMISAAIKYKKIHFDGDFVRMVIRPAIGAKIHITEPLYLYEGVRLRTEFLQFGLINKTKYIIELAHKDENKIIPLYISTSNKNLRKIWENYAKELRLPALANTDSGEVSKDYHDLDVPLKEMILKGKYLRPIMPKTPRPRFVWIAQKRANIVIKIRRFLFDAYNVIAFVLLAGFAFLISMMIKEHNELILYFSENILFGLYAISFAIIMYSLMLMTKRDKLIIKPDKVVLFHKYVFFSLKEQEIYKDKIKEVDIICNPASGRSYIAIISDDQTMVVGKKMPLADMRWLRQYIICELIK